MAIDRRHPREIRADIRSGKITSVTAGLGEGHVQANLGVLPRDYACVFHGPMVVSMRPIPSTQLSKAVTASARFPNAHGAPVHIGDPAAIGIKDVTKPEWGDAQPFRPGDVPVFWACGVTPQAVALASKPPFMITHSPGHMFITDLPNSALAAL